MSIIIRLKEIIKSIYLIKRFYIAFAIVINFFIISFFVKILFPFAQLLLIVFIIILITDIIWLNNRNIKFSVKRIVRKKLSLGHNHNAKLVIENQSPIKFNIWVIDELPKELQIRDFGVRELFKAYQQKEITYNFRPLKRGLYYFGKVHLFLESEISFVRRRYSIDLEESVPVYPSLVEMKNYELYNKNNYIQTHGIKKIRRIGNSHEFEQIKTYVHGDDFQKINWKASGRGQGLMVNHFEDEKAQPVYLLLDKGRNMKMSFDGLSLLDYSINTGLTVANTAIRKKDRAGLITFSEKVNTIIGAGNGTGHLERILKSLYNEKEGSFDANYESLYKVIKNKLPVRSLLFLFTNFESKNSAEQVLPIFRQINNQHLLVVIIFENTELIKLGEKWPSSTEEEYVFTQAEQLVNDKKEIAVKMQQYGIQTVLTAPESLTMDVLNKYLELKARGMI